MALLGDLVDLLEVKPVLIPVYESFNIGPVGVQRQCADYQRHDDVHRLSKMENYHQQRIQEAGHHRTQRHIAGRDDHRHLRYEQNQRDQRIGENDEAEGRIRMGNRRNRQPRQGQLR